MKKHKKIIAWVLLILWMILIFLMSHQPGEVSSNQSDLVLNIFRLIGIELNDYFGDLATFFVRKLAHFSEYMILFFFTYNVLRYYIKERKARIFSVIFVFLYACTDEIHQFFVPGRNMAFKDVLIDTSGGVFGYILLSILYKIKLIRNKK